MSAYRGESVDQRCISVGGRCSFVSGLGPMYFSLKSSLRRRWNVFFSLIEFIVRFLFIYTKGRFCLFLFQKKSFSFGAMEVNWSRPSAYRWRKEILKFGLIDTCTGFSFWIRSASYWQDFALPLFSPKLWVNNKPIWKKLHVLWLSIIWNHIIRFTLIYKQQKLYTSVTELGFYRSLICLTNLM